MNLRLQRDGRTFDLKDLKSLGSGGEAHVYALAGISLAAKIYHRHVNGRDEKLRVMLANPPKNPTASQGHISIAWPQDLLIDQHGRTVGFVMPLVDQMREIGNFYNPKTRREKCRLFNYQYLATTALNLAIAVRALHQRGYVMGDVNQRNILVAETTMVTLVDTDSFQVREPGNGKIHHCTVGSPEFTPREMQGVDFSIVERREEQDLFGLGVLLFQLLMEGFHPFQARYAGAGDSPEPFEMIREGHFPHGTGSAMWQTPPMAPHFGMLDPQLRNLFTRCFVSGHRDPKARPTANEWCSTLKRSVENLIQCKGNSSHLHWPHVKTCPWCERKGKLGGRDPFPPPPQSNPTDHSISVSVPVKSAPAQTIKAAAPWWKRIFTRGSSVATPTQLAARPVQKPAATVFQPAASASPRPASSISRPVSPQVQKPAGVPVQSPTPVPTPQVTPQVRKPAAAPVQPATQAPSPKAPRPMATSIQTVTPTPIAALTSAVLDTAGEGEIVVMNLGGGDEIKLRLTRGRWISQDCIDQSQWRAVMGWVPKRVSGWGRPVEDVSVDMLQAFCAQLSQKGMVPPGWSADCFDISGKSGWYLSLSKNGPS